LHTRDHYLTIGKRYGYNLFYELNNNIFMNDEEFTAIVTLTKTTVLAAIKRHLPAEIFHAVDDVVQETYFRAYRSIGKSRFENESALRGWLYKIAKNESLRMVLKLKRDMSIVDKVKSAHGYSENTPVNNHGEFDESLIELIHELPEKYRAVLELKILGFSEKDISRNLLINKGTVKSRHSKGRELLSRLANERKDYASQGS
jgi:RNA polymerase sigma-70 factor (ECF subfamily)